MQRGLKFFLLSVAAVAISVGCNTQAPEQAAQPSELQVKSEAVKAELAKEGIDLSLPAQNVPNMTADEVLAATQSEDEVGVASSEIAQAFARYKEAVETPEVGSDAQNTWLTRNIALSSIGRFQQLRANQRSYESAYNYRYDRDGRCSNPVWGFDHWNNFFREACRVHDFAYANYKMHGLANEIERGVVDFQFLLNLYAICQGLPERSGWTFPRATCRAAALTYYTGVRRLGGLPSSDPDAFYGPKW